MLFKSTIDKLRMPWEAIFRCADEYKREHPEFNDRLYTEYMREQWGIDHNDNGIDVVDDQKYLLFLLRYSK